MSSSEVNHTNWLSFKDWTLETAVNDPVYLFSIISLLTLVCLLFLINKLKQEKNKVNKKLRLKLKQKEEEIKKIFSLLLVDHNPEEFFKYCTNDVKFVLHPRHIAAGIYDKKSIFNY